MSVVPLKQYSYLDWCTIARSTNALRIERGIEPWSVDDAWSLWQSFFRTPG